MTPYQIQSARKNKKKICLVCEKIFYDYRVDNKKCCSQKCSMYLMAKNISKTRKKLFKDGKITPHNIGKTRFKNDEEKKEAMLEHGRKSYKKHIKKRRIYYRNLNHKRRGAIGSFKNSDWEKMKLNYGYICPCCGKKEPVINLTIDHIIPLSVGGSNFIDNIQPLCLSCNVKKHTKAIYYFPRNESLECAREMIK